MPSDPMPQPEPPAPTPSATTDPTPRAGCASEWRGAWNNWIAPFHFCARCGESLAWQQHEDALDRPLIEAEHCGVTYTARLSWE